MNFADYYSGDFRRDLERIVAEGWRAHANEPGGTIIQPRTVSVENPVIIELADERRVHFATALFFTVLVDQVMFTHYRCSYASFRKLTQYPKLRGDCPGGCRNHPHPLVVFDALARPQGSGIEAWSPWAEYADWLPYYESSISEAIPVMRSELLSFLRAHLPNLKSEKVWDRCMAEPPLSWLQPA